MKRRNFCQASIATGAADFTTPWIWTQAKTQGAGLSSIVNTSSGRL